MSTNTIPSLTRTVNNAFTQTWDLIRPDITDNVLEAAPLSAALKERGVFVPQEGGDTISKSIRYATKTVDDVAKGDVFESSDDEIQTRAQWGFKNFGASVQHNLFDDRANRAEFQIRDYVNDQIQAVRDALAQKLETGWFSAFKSNETGKIFQSFHDMLPSAANRGSGTFGNLTRCTAFSNASADAQREIANSSTATNPWWTPRYYKFLLPLEVNLEKNLRAHYDDVANDFEPPDLMVTTREMLQLYEDFVSDRRQIVIKEGSRLAQLGFTEFQFKNASMISSVNCPASSVFTLTTAFIKMIYDPMLWFSMGEWEKIPKEQKWQASIICTCNLICDQLRRQGRAYDAAVG